MKDSKKKIGGSYPLRGSLQINYVKLAPRANTVLHMLGIYTCPVQHLVLE